MERKRKKVDNKINTRPSYKKTRFSKTEGVKPNDPSAVEQALWNHLILTQVFKYLNTGDLINLRRVNSKWNDVAASTLIKRQSYMLTFDRRFVKGGKPPTKQITAALPNSASCPVASTSTSISKSKPKRSAVKPSQTDNMIELNLCIANSKKFPCTVLDIGMGKWNFEHENFKSFAQLCGPNIKVLELNLNFSQPMRIFRDLFLRDFPNVEHLAIKSINIRSLDGSGDENSDELFPTLQGRVFLLSLRTIRFDSSNHKTMFQNLLDAAVNLKRIEHCSVEMVDVLEKCEKISSLKGLSIEPRSINEHQSLYTQLAILQPKLENLTICYHSSIDRVTDVPPELLSALTIILYSSSQTLKKLELGAMSFLSGMLIFPVLPSLTILILGGKQQNTYTNMENCQRIFPRGLELARAFPNLKTVVIRFKAFCSINFPEDQFWRDDGRIDKIYTVECLVLETEVNYGMKHFGAKFPTLKQVIFVNYGWTKPLSNLLWKLPTSVETVEFRKLRFNANLMNGDSFFTGFHNEICDNLRRLKRNPTSIDINVLEVMPSIRNVQNLKRLKMVFSQPKCGGKVVQHYFEGKPFISEVTGLYAFGQMPELSVVFAYDFHGPVANDIARIFEPMRPYLSLAHEEFKKENDQY